MRQSHLAQLALLSILVLACQYIGVEPSPSAQPDVTSSPVATATAAVVETLPPTSPSPSLNEPTESPPPPPSDTPMPTATLAPSPTPAPFSPLPVPTVLDPTTKDIDQFWQQFLELSCVEMGMEDYWDSVAQMSQDVEVVLVGHPVSVTVRSDAGGLPEGAVGIAVDELLKGNPATEHAGIVEITDEGQGAWDWQPDWPSEPIPGTPTLLFLRNEAAAAARYGNPVDPGDEYLYYMPGVHQNVLTELDGKVYVPQTPRMTRWYGTDFFPLPLSGMSWDRLLGQVRDAITQGSSPERVQHGIRAAC